VAFDVARTDQLPRSSRPRVQSSVGWRMAIELIDGEALVIPPSGAVASSVQGELFFALRSWQDAVGDGGLLLQDVFVELPRHQFLAPDIAWWSGPRRPPVREGASAVVPDLVVEVLSPATRLNALGVKRNYYLDVGVHQLWLADPAARTLVRAQPTMPGEELTSRDTLDTHLLAGFLLALPRVFAAP
jgi:Uma2 family endonuclease